MFMDNDLFLNFFIDNDLKVSPSFVFETGSPTALGLDNKNKTD